MNLGVFRMKRRKRSLPIDGETINILVQSLTVREVGEVLQLGYPRGPKPTDLLFADRVFMIDKYLQVESGSVFYDDVPVHSGLASLFSARKDIIEALYYEVLLAQTISKAESESLDIAARFSYWLATHQDSPSHWVKTSTSCILCRIKGLCDRRGCDGVEKKQVVWRDKKWVLHSCPILHFTPEIEEILRVFHATHQFQDGIWVRTALVAVGGIEDQDSWQMSALGHLRSVHQDIVTESRKDA